MYQAEKFLKCKELTTETECTWNVKTKGTPVIIGSTGSISKSFIKYLKT